MMPILLEVLERWHPHKLEIARSDWQQSLDWMKRENYVPTGFGRATTESPPPELF
jgi:hypothetical protein